MRRPLVLGIVICLFYLFLHLLIIGDYGISWDFHYHLYGGLYHLGLPVPRPTDPAPVPFTPPDPRLTVADPFGPIMGIVPALSYQLFYTTLGLLPFDVAYNLPSVLYGVLGLGLLFFFIYQAMGERQAVFASLFLGLLPAYFGYLHVNMKDIPVAVMFCASIYFFWRLVTYKKVLDLVLASIFFGITFSIKVNAIFIPLICFAWVLFKYKTRLWEKSNRIILSYFFTSIFAALFIWWPFWDDPIAKLLELKETFSHNTYNMPVLLGGTTYRSGVSIPFWYPYFYIAITTPLLLLSFFFVGLVSCFSFLWRKPFYLLLILWFFIPLLRFFMPSVGVIDGVRHFMEVVFPFCVISSVGFVTILSFIQKIKIFTRRAPVLFVLFVVLLLTLPLVTYHPYQTSFYNSLVGGIRGANGMYDVDFWGTPQKEAMQFLNEHAERRSSIHVVMAQSSAAEYLRDDLRTLLNSKSIFESDYVVILNRPSFWNDDIRGLLSLGTEKQKVIYTRNVDQVPLVWVIRR